MKKFLIITGMLIFAVIIIFFALLKFQEPKIKLFNKLLTRSLNQVRQDYAKESCQKFTDQEIKQGYFEALVTGYCRPQLRDFKNRDDFLCAVGLNCSCPNGRDDQAGCALSGSLVWSPCKDFDETKIAYCQQNALQTKPQAGDVAADWNCFKPNSTITINNQNYLVTDKGSAITGRRFDVWFDDCQQAFKVLGIYKIKL